MIHDMKTRIAALKKIYQVYESFTETLDSACQKGCGTCCTRNVTLTSLEGLYLFNSINPELRIDLISAVNNSKDTSRMIPKITLNHMAALCMEGKEIPEEESDPTWGPCPFLTDNVCPAYDARPFACRCMVSNQYCGDTGVADMDDFTVTVNNVLMQYIEHVDSAGFTGNFTDVLLILENETIRSDYASGTLKPPMGDFIQNQPVRVLMIPPEHREKIRPMLEELQRF